MARLHSLFPVPVMQVEGFAEPAFCQQLQKLTDAQALSANAKSSELSHTAILIPDSKPVLQKLARALEPHLAEFGEQLFGEKLRWHVKELWLNLLHTGGHQSTHAHANSLISGVIYLNTCDPSAHLVFHKPMGGGEFIFSNTHPGARTTPYNGAKWVLPSQHSGDLVLFPSYLLHEVPQNAGGLRLSLAFNALPDRLTSHGYSVRFSR